MAYDEGTARELILSAGLRLIEHKLIARTWGNISARISETQFLVTPSGLAYETLRPEQLVVVNLADCSYSGDMKPSSEKGFHADIYRLRPEVNFIIHTHQNMASAVSVAGETLTDYAREFEAVLGLIVPCADYGISATKKLRMQVKKAAARNPTFSALLLRRHGTICVGRSLEEAFDVSLCLEKLCEQLMPSPAADKPLSALLDSYRSGESFCRNGKTVSLADTNLDPLTAIHAAIYRKHSEVQFILAETSPDVVVASKEGNTRPLLDDLAQIAGISIRCVPPEPVRVSVALKGRNAVLIKNSGALCTGKNLSDAQAVCLLLRKNCLAQRYTALLPGIRPLGYFDAWLQRTFYVLKYSAQKERSHS